MSFLCIKITPKYSELSCILLQLLLHLGMVFMDKLSNMLSYGLTDKELKIHVSLVRFRPEPRYKKPLFKALFYL